MNFPSFFINRPIFASVLSIVTFMIGLIALSKLPISEYPEVSPPSVVVTAFFPGANPSEIAETVATPLEEQINGVENMLYMSSLASSDGALSLTITFAIGTDPDLAQQLVQNRVSQALPRLPDITRQLGVTTVKSSPDLTMVVHLISPNNEYDVLYLRNYATLNVKDELAKIQGVGTVRLFGSGDYAMRIWLDPYRIAERNLTAADVTQAIRGQNTQVAAGIIGGPPYAKDVEVQYPVNVRGRLESVEEFENIIIKRDPSGTITRLKDVAHIEIEAQTYSLRSLLNNQQAVAIPIFSSPGSNALQISDDVRETMKRLQASMPPGVSYSIVYDPTVFVRDSIHSVIITLLEAVALVVLVVIMFLQTWRASIIPLLAVPVSIVGTFAFMYFLGFSINVLSLFGLILAIGVVVDDAIVVVENVERNIDNGLNPHQATVQAMKEVTGPVIATSLVLAGVFIPIAFISGLTGQFYKQFAMTITFAVLISTLNSLTLSPALSAFLLKSRSAPKDGLTRLIQASLSWFFKGFNACFEWSRRRYKKILCKATRHTKLIMLVFAALTGLTALMFQKIPQGFVPSQDKGYLISFAILPSGATLDRTEKVIRQMADIALKQPGVVGAVQFPGLSINGFVNAPNAGITFVRLADFDQRRDQNLSGFAIAAQLQQKFAQIDEAFIAIFPPPPVRGLGTIGGFKLQIEDRGDQGYAELNKILTTIVTKANQDPALSRVFSSYNINVPQLLANVDRTKAQKLGIPIEDVFRTLQIYLGSLYINDFNLFGRTYQVIAQADKDFRSQPSDILKLQTRNQAGQMIPLGSIVNVEETFGPDIAVRYNAFRSADLNGDAAPGYSSGQAQAAISRILKENLPQDMDYEWTDLTYQQILAGNTAIIIFPLCLLLVFLILAAQYESLTLPLAVILIVPMAILSALVGIWITKGDNNIFTQISLFVLAGLASKNAILIVEFARELERKGYSVVLAAIEASQLRLRPILMTSISFIMGVLPLVLSHGAGSEMRRAIGISVFSGMVGVTLFGLIFTPLFYIVVRTLELRFHQKKNSSTEE